jgi:hypothetical protein
MLTLFLITFIAFNCLSVYAQSTNDETQETISDSIASRKHWVSNFNKNVGKGGSAFLAKSDDTIVHITIDPHLSELENVPNLSAAYLAFMSEELYDSGFTEAHIDLKFESACLRFNRKMTPPQFILSCNNKEWKIRWAGPSSWNDLGEIRAAAQYLMGH